MEDVTLVVVVEVFEEVDRTVTGFDEEHEGVTFRDDDDRVATDTVKEVEEERKENSDEELGSV